MLSPAVLQSTTLSPSSHCLLTTASVQTAGPVSSRWVLHGDHTPTSTGWGWSENEEINIHVQAHLYINKCISKTFGVITSRQLMRPGIYQTCPVYWVSLEHQASGSHSSKMVTFFNKKTQRTWSSQLRLVKDDPALLCVQTLQGPCIRVVMEIWWFGIGFVWQWRTLTYDNVYIHIIIHYIL